MSIYAIFGKLPTDFIASRSEQWVRLLRARPSRTGNKWRFVAENYRSAAHNEIDPAAERAHPWGPGQRGGPPPPPPPPPPPHPPTPTPPSTLAIFHSEFAKIFLFL
jgi:hypothetical protein